MKVLTEVTMPSLLACQKYANIINLKRMANHLASEGIQSRLKSKGLDFSEVRAYEYGDDVRSIDWRVTARKLAPHTKLYSEEQDRPVFLIGDFRESMHFATQGEFKSVVAAKLLAAYGFHALKKGDRVGALYMGAQIVAKQPNKGLSAYIELLSKLIPVAHSGTQPSSVSMESLLKQANQLVRPGSLIVLVSDWSDLNAKVECQLRKLAMRNHVVLNWVYDVTEKQLPPKGQWPIYVGDKVRVVESNTKNINAYAQQFEKRLNLWQQFSYKNRIQFQHGTTLKPVLSWLLK